MISPLTAKVLADPDNDLAANVADFDASGDLVWHIDRHVIKVDKTAPIVDACVAAIALGRHWFTQAASLPSGTRWISKPHVIIDVSWLEGDGSYRSPPPHVYVCLARDEIAFDPVLHTGLVERSSIGIPEIDAYLVDEGQLFWLAGEDESLGCWFVELFAR